MASGFAFVTPENGIKYHKAPTPGGNLKLKGLPRNAKTVILHTRLATQGSVTYNENNHPVLSPNNLIALTHNGVIYNDDSLKRNELAEYEFPEVDSAVIAGILQKYGVNGIDKLAGYAAIAWLEVGYGDTLNIARIEDAPIAYTSLMDGSFVYASTQPLLESALDKTGLKYGAIRFMLERDYFIVQDGIVMVDTMTPKMEGKFQYSTGQITQFKNLTSGNHGSEGTPATTSHSAYGEDWPETDGDEIGTPHGDLPGMWRELTDDEIEAAEIQSDYDYYLANSGKPNEDEQAYGKAMVLLGYAFGGDMYYTTDSYGNEKTYSTLEDLEADLKWHAGLHVAEDFYGAEGLARWCEHFVDVGSERVDGQRVSWIDDPSEILYHEDPNGDGLAYIDEGVGYLRSTIGR